jgi:hypothetical protein
LESLKAVLATLPTDELQSFKLIWSTCLARAYTYKIWAAAYLIGAGCGDDGFWDFRSTLIMQGKAFFEATLADPDSLAETDFDEDNENNYPFSEGYQYVPQNIIEARGGAIESGPDAHPSASLGEPWTEDMLPRLLPKLHAKFGS